MFASSLDHMSGGHAWHCLTHSAPNVGPWSKERQFLLDVEMGFARQQRAGADVAVWNLDLVEQISAKSGRR